MLKVTVLARWPESLESDGVAQHVTNLVKYLGKSSGLSMRVVSFSKTSKTLLVGSIDVTLIKRNPIYYIIPPLAVARLILEVKKYPPDILHLQGANLSPYLIYWLFFSRGAKKVVTLHSIPTREIIAQKKIRDKSFAFWMLRWIEKATMKGADTIITVTSRLAGFVGKDFGEESQNKVVVIPNAVDLTSLHLVPDMEKARTHLNLNQEDFIIFHAKSFVSNNGQQFLIQAMPIILNQIPNARLILAGDGPTRRGLEQLCNQIEVSERVVFLGNIRHGEVFIYISSADVIILPSVRVNSFEEGSSVFLLEGMAMSKPVIATEVGGSPETIRNGVNGLLIPDSSSVAIADSVIEIHRNKSEAEDLGRRARAFVEEERSWRIVAELTLKEYEETIRTSAPIRNH